ncbi:MULTISPECIES: serine/threonine-protein kinase [Streptomyces]|uniref:serine/threonine-protein kinase n=1 Tax=Streptomyces TaxID=1883 RepID=UPI000F65792E|nr:serine/threonine-protein kinase [Streptomyces alboflavus]
MSADGGRVLGGRYRLAERIGSGGMGTVWRAVDELVGREVAVKEPRLPGDPHDAAARRAYERLRREARAAASVDHPAAVAIHDVVVDDERPWIVMELVRGESLHEVLRRGALAPAESARIGLALVGALAAAHAQGIVHRDVKPANVLLGAHGRVVLTDFGIARVQGEESLTVSGEFVGSLEFIAPERMAGHGAEPASDLWSLGVLLFAAVEGWSPFRRTTLESTLAAVLSADVPEPARAGELAPLISRLLSRDPGFRPGAGEVAAALEAVAEGRPLPEPFGTVVAQDPSGMRELSDDVGTVRLSRGGAGGAGAGGGVGPGAGPGAVADVGSGSGAGRGRAGGRRTPALVAAALVGALLVGGGVWLGTSMGSAGGGSGETRAERTKGAEGGESGARGSATPAPRWKVRPERALVAEMPVPARYKVVVREDGDDDRQRTGSRLVIYAEDENSDVTVRLTKEDGGSTPALTWARQAAETWHDSDNGARTNYTKTSHRGDDAAIADTTYDDDSMTTPVRCLQLMIITADQEFYELRVDMPKGTAQEKEGTELFKGVRARLKVGKDSVKG